MKSLQRSIFSLFIFTILFASCSLQSGRSQPVYEDWKIKFDDNKSYAAAYFDDSSWQTSNASGLIKLQKDQHYFWLRKSINVPASFLTSNVWIGFQKTNCAIEVYANGTYIGTRGSFPPNVSVKIEQNTDVLIPSNFIKDASVKIALRVYAPGNTAKDICPSIDDDTQGYFMNKVKNIFNQKIFLWIGVLCAFILFYSLL